MADAGVLEVEGLEVGNAHQLASPASPCALTLILPMPSVFAYENL